MQLSGPQATANVCMSISLSEVSTLTKHNQCNTAQLPSLSFLTLSGSEKMSTFLFFLKKRESLNAGRSVRRNGNLNIHNRHAKFHKSVILDI